MLALDSADALWAEQNGIDWNELRENMIENEVDDIRYAEAEKK